MNLNEKKLKEVELDEVSIIEIKTFEIGSIRGFHGFNLSRKLEELEKLNRSSRVLYSFSADAIGLGDAFQRAMNALYEGNGEAALIVEKRVLTLRPK